MNVNGIRAIIDNIPREELVEKVYGWMQEHPDFQDFLTSNF